jgi:cytidine deaminase
MKEKLKEYFKNTYAPYSKYEVVACVVTKDNKEFYGVNIENISYGATICAERVAVNTAIANGYRKGDFKALYVMTKNELSYPCFLCRQTISEFFTGEEDLILYSLNEENNYKIKDIITKPFISKEVQ